MSRLSRSSFPQTFTKSLAVVACFAVLVSTTPLVSAEGGQAKLGNWLSFGSQGQRNEPRPGPPEGVFPNMDGMRTVTDDARRNGARVPDIPAPIPSTRRRWRNQLSALGKGMLPSRGLNVESRNLLASLSTPATLESLWQPEPRGPISDSPFKLFSASRNAYANAPLPQGSPNFALARLAPQNRSGIPGVDLLSGNFNWGLGLIGLRGRSGLDLGLGLSYNSKVWTRSGNYINFDVDNGTLAPGFRLGFPTVQGLYYNDQAGAYF